MAVPAGAKPAYAFYGAPVSGIRLAHTEGARIAAASGPYIGRGNKCSANDDTCDAVRAKGTELCAGHLRSKAKKLEMTDGSNKTDES